MLQKTINEEKLVINGYHIPNYKKLTAIDLSKHLNLKQLSLRGNNLTHIDLRNNKMLTELRLSENKLAKIDLSANT